MTDLKREGERIATLLAKAVPEGSDMGAVMVGVAAFLAYLVDQFYEPPLAKQAIVAHANLAWDMYQNMNGPEVEGEYEEEPEDEAEAPQKPVMQ